MTKGVIDLDDTDRAMLRALSLEGDLTAGELGRRFGLSQPAAWRRVKRMEEAGDELLMWLGEDISESNGQLLQDAWHKAKEAKP